MTCSVCSECYHFKCLPNIDTSDSVYLDRDSLPWICIICSGSIFPCNQCVDDCDFLEAISELWDIKPIASFSNFRDRTFLPYELNSDRTHQIDEIDPDFNIYCTLYDSSLPSCDYYTEDTYNVMCSGNGICDSKLSLINSNIRSILCNLSNFTSNLENLNSKFSVMAFTETWLKEYNHETYGITGYNAVHNYRTTKIGGGVAL